MTKMTQRTQRTQLTQMTQMTRNTGGQKASQMIDHMVYLGKAF